MKIQYPAKTALWAVILVLVEFFSSNFSVCWSTGLSFLQEYIITKRAIIKKMFFFIKMVLKYFLIVVNIDFLET